MQKKKLTWILFVLSILAKLLRELILPVETRISDVRNFLQAIDNTLTYDVIPIQDPFGPTKSDPNLDVMVFFCATYCILLKRIIINYDIIFPHRL